MPIYEYECTECGKIEEAFQKFSDSPLTTCKYCSGELHKLISQSAFHLKGTGWYVTDYSNKSRNNTTTSKSETPSSGSESSSGSDSTSATSEKTADKTS